MRGRNELVYASALVASIACIGCQVGCGSPGAPVRASDEPAAQSSGHERCEAHFATLAERWSGTRTATTRESGVVQNDEYLECPDTQQQDGCESWARHQILHRHGVVLSCEVEPHTDEDGVEARFTVDGIERVQHQTGNDAVATEIRRIREAGHVVELVETHAMSVPASGASAHVVWAPANAPPTVTWLAEFIVPLEQQQYSSFLEDVAALGVYVPTMAPVVDTHDVRVVVCCRE